MRNESKRISVLRKLARESRAPQARRPLQENDSVVNTSNLGRGSNINVPSL